MLVGLMTDTHDRLPAIAELVTRMQAAGVGFLLHAGDFCSPFSLIPFFERNMAVGGIFGRNDGDPEGIRAKASQGMGVELYESPHSFEISGQRILLVHDLGDVNERSIEGHALVVHGCSHQREIRTQGKVTIVNPGEACGWLTGKPSAAIVDLDTMKVDWLTLEGKEWAR
ncbi:MAG TPA: YfcE family phosphodiesterase [Gemmatimonadaceae bacterium]|nr:YfcE family phosphodiesterase [Gemmatimonadaceae bacterium]